MHESRKNEHVAADILAAIIIFTYGACLSLLLIAPPL